MKYLLMALFVVVLLYFDIRVEWSPYDLTKIIALYVLSGIILVVWFIKGVLWSLQ